MTHTTTGAAPDVMYEPSFCNQALLDAGLDIVPPATLSSLARTWPTPDRPHHYATHTGGPYGFSETRLLPERDIPYASSRRLRQLRVAAQKTLREVSEATGVPFWAINKYERGGVNPANARFGRIAALADYYGVPVSDVLGSHQEASAA